MFFIFISLNLLLVKACVDSQCGKCTKADVCEVCKNGWYLGEDLYCYPCGDQIRGCSSCSVNNTKVMCKECNDRFFLDLVENKCFSCGQIYTGCVTCARNNSAINCLGCQNQHYLAKNNECLSCKISQCKQCQLSADSTAVMCINCNNNFTLVNNSCLLCENMIRNCKLCTTAKISNCTNCIQGYYANAKWDKCMSCQELIKGCSKCRAQGIWQLGQCLTCNQDLVLSGDKRSCDQKSKIGMILGIVGGCLGLGAIVGGVFYYKKRKEKATLLNEDQKISQ